MLAMASSGPRQMLATRRHAAKAQTIMDPTLATCIAFPIALDADNTVVSTGTPLAWAHHGWIGYPIAAAYSDGSSQRSHFHDQMRLADRRIVGITVRGRANRRLCDKST